MFTKKNDTENQEIQKQATRQTAQRKHQHYIQVGVETRRKRTVTPDVPRRDRCDQQYQ